MKKQLAALVAALTILGGAADADTVRHSCRILSVVGANNVQGVSGLVSELAGTWKEENRKGLSTQLERLLATFRFAGGNVYRVRRFGGDIDQHLIVLRLDGGEVSGLLVRYEWGGETMRLVGMSFERKYERYITGISANIIDPVDCRAQ